MVSLLSKNEWYSFKKSNQQESVQSDDDNHLNVVWQQRLNDLTNNITEDTELLKDYEDALRVEDEPRRRLKYKRQIKQLRSSVTKYWEEYNELQRKSINTSHKELVEIPSRLQAIETKLDKLKKGQRDIQKELSETRQTILSHFDVNTQALITELLEKYDYRQLKEIDALLNNFDAIRISEEEIHSIINEIKYTLIELAQQNEALPLQENLIDAIEKPTLGIKHKLKITLPIIPMLLGYEGEVELENKANLETLWNQFIPKRKGKKP